MYADHKLTMRQSIISEIDRQAHATEIGKTLAAAINQSLAHLEISVEASIDDSSLILNLTSDRAQDPVRLMELVSREVAALSVRSIARVKVYGWRTGLDSSEQDSSEQNLSKATPSWRQEFILSSFASDGRQSNSNFDRSNRSINRLSANKTETEDSQSDPKMINLDIERLKKELAKGVGNKMIGKSNPLDPNPSLRFSHDVTTGIHETIAVNIKSLAQNSRPSQMRLLPIGAAIILLGLGLGICIKLLTAGNNSNIPSQSSSQTSNYQNQPSDLNPAIAPQGSQTTSPSDDISLTEFQQIKKGMKLDQVQQIIGSSGRLIADSKVGNITGQVYSWKNSVGSNAIIEFKNGVVVAKAQAGLQ